MGLLKTGMKAMVAVKTADVIHERVQARQRQQWEAYGHPSGMAPAGAPAPAAVPTSPPAAPAPAAPAADTGSVLAQLTQLGELKTSGVLTDAEFEVQKARILSA